MAFNFPLFHEVRKLFCIHLPRCISLSVSVRVSDTRNHRPVSSLPKEAYLLLAFVFPKSRSNECVELKDHISKVVGQLTSICDNAEGLLPTSNTLPDPLTLLVSHYSCSRLWARADFCSDPNLYC